MATDSLQQRAQDGLKICDLVMKGGITSGIVYPPAVLALKEGYHFANIGGTSAGAIAAAGTAAAEYNREHGGFEQLEAMRNWLGEDNHLRNLFQASPETQPLLDILYAMLGDGKAAATTTNTSGKVADQEDTSKPARVPLFIRVLGWVRPALPQPVLQAVGRLIPTWVSSYQPFKHGGRIGRRWGVGIGVIQAAVLSLILLGVVSLFGISTSVRVGILLIAFVFFGAVLGLILGWFGTWVGRVIWVGDDLLNLLTVRVPKNFYGVCKGHSATPDGTNLTDWLSDLIDRTAGLELHTAPLTFGQLSEKQVELKMVTSNLSHAQPYVLPEGLQNFLFQESDMRELFPNYVVDHMIKSPPDPQETIVPQGKLPEGFYFLPDWRQLPVVFGARMSLSFPLLLSAVPLYTVSTSAYNDLQNGKISQLEPAHMQQNWFSDGGICSNFPIQFFDAWLPRRPTFGISLAPVSVGTSALQVHYDDQGSAAAEACAAGENVYLPRAEDRQEPEWHGLDRLDAFLFAVFTTAQNYRDAMQANLPSYRERIVQVHLDANEGGLNLTMPPETIRTLVEKGQKAGEIFSDTNKFNFDHHWWVRFLVLMAQLEQNIGPIQAVLENPGFETRLEQQLRSIQDPQLRYPYYHDKVWCDEAKERVKELRDWITYWQEASRRREPPPLFHDGAPLPNPVLRMTPEV